MSFTAIDRETLTDAQARGSALLDDVHPGWRAELDVDRLDLNAVYDCVLGQLYPREGYLNAVRRLYDLEVAALDGNDWSIHHGFNARVPVDGMGYYNTPYPVRVRYGFLTALWIADVIGS